jgi:hypothetical protein
MKCLVEDNILIATLVKTILMARSEVEQIKTDLETQ